MCRPRIPRPRPFSLRCGFALIRQVASTVNCWTSPSPVRHLRRRRPGMRSSSRIAALQHSTITIIIITTGAAVQSRRMWSALKLLPLLTARPRCTDRSRRRPSWRMSRDMDKWMAPICGHGKGFHRREGAMDSGYYKCANLEGGVVTGCNCELCAWI